MLSPEELAASGTGGYFLLGLDQTGITEASPPAELARAFTSWRHSGLVAPDIASAFDAIAAKHHGVMVASFLNGVSHGFGACTVELALGGTVLLTFWDRLNEYGCMLVVTTLVDDVAGGAAPTPTVKPLRCIQRMNVVGIIEYIDEATTTMLGWGPEVVGVSRLKFQHPDSIKAGMLSWPGLVANPGHEIVERRQFRLGDGTYRWFDSRAINRIHTHGYIEIEMIDVDEHMVRRANQHTHVAVADALAGLSPDGVAVLDQHNFLVAINEHFCELTGAAIDDDRRRLVFPPTPVFKQLAEQIAQVRSGARDVDLRSEVSLPVEVSHIDNPDNPDEPLVLVVVKPEAASSALPKGYSQHTLDRIISGLAEAGGPDGLGYTDLAASCGTSEVTARRYIAYLDSQGIVEMTQDYGSPGRPRKRFRLASRD